MSYWSEISQTVSGLGSELGSVFDGPGDAATKDALKKGKQYNYLGENPYQSQWAALLDQLHQTALGKGPSLAGMAYNKAQQQGLANQVALSHGNSAGAARAGALGLAQQQQGYASGYGQARTAEEMQANQQYQAALSAADSSQFNRDSANQNAYLQALKGAQGQQSTLQKALGAGAQVASIAGVGGAGGGAAAKGMMAQTQPNQGPPGMTPTYGQGQPSQPMMNYGPPGQTPIADYSNYFSNKGY